MNFIKEILLTIVISLGTAMIVNVLNILIVKYFYEYINLWMWINGLTFFVVWLICGRYVMKKIKG